jgi:hypothetical protein
MQMQMRCLPGWTLAMAQWAQNIMKMVERQTDAVLMCGPLLLTMEMCARL